MSLVIAKFGGTSVADYPSMVKCARIVLTSPKTRLVVLSASSGVTNLLVELTQANITDDIRLSRLSEIALIQHEIMDKLPRSEVLSAQIDLLLSRVTFLSESLVLNRSKQLIDELLSVGEQCSSLLFSYVLRQQGQVAEVFDAREVMKTDSNYGKAEPQLNDIAVQASERLRPLLDESVIVTQGFIGANVDGKTTTLGRGGSDYSAALLAEALNADTVEIWTDVAGIYTTDPRLAPNARAIQEISFNEAAEMATFGAKVLHPATILPAVRKGIQVFVGSSKAPDNGGTWIRNRIESLPTFRAVAIRRDQTLLNLHSFEMLHTHGFLADVFAILARHKISVDLITTSEVNVSLTLDKTGSDSSGHTLLSESLLRELEHHCRVKVETNLSLVAIIGNKIPSTAGVCHRVFEVLSNFNVRMSSFGASEHNLCFLISENDAKDVIDVLHRDLFES